MAETDPLKTLLLDAKEVDRTTLAQALSGILGVDTATGRVVLKPGFNSLDTRRKVLAFLLGVKAAFLLGKGESEAMANKDIIANTGMPTGTVNPKLKELRDRRLVSQTKEGMHYVASHQVMAAVDHLQGED
jgi:hypothetical protein